MARSADDILREDAGLTDAALLARVRAGKMVSVGTLNERMVAQLFIEDRMPLRSYQGMLYEYIPEKKHYVQIVDIPGTLRRFVEDLYEEQTETVRAIPLVAGFGDQILPRGIKGSWLQDVEASLLAATQIQQGMQPPCWLAEVEEFEEAPEGTEDRLYRRPLIDPNRTFIATANKLIDVDAYVRTGKVIEPTADLSDWFALHRLPHKYREGATCPQWERFLAEVLEDDEERINLLQEWFGYVLTSNTGFHKFLLLEGEGRNGKGVVVDVMTGLIGRDAVSSLSLTAFTGRFDKYHTFGKMLNVSSEAEELTKRLESELKAFTGGDLISTDRKHREIFQFKATARLVVSTNNRPRVADESNGFWDRMLLLPFNVFIPEHKRDRDLAARILASEAEGVLQWSLIGLRRLYTQRQFTEPLVCKREKQEYRQESNPVFDFVGDCVLQDEGASVEVGALYDAYVLWCKRRGEKPKDHSSFGKSLTRVCHGYETHQVRKQDGSRRRYYIGLGLIKGKTEE